MFQRAFVFLFMIAQIYCLRTGKLTLIKSDASEHVLLTKYCTGVYFESVSSISQYTSARIDGLWAFYDKYCGGAVFLVAGVQYCFQLDPAKPFTQIHLIGNPKNVFEAAISRFQMPNFGQLTFTITDDEFFSSNSVREMSTTGSWVTVTSTEWTVYANNGQSLCLAPTVKGYRIFCTFNRQLIAELERRQWDSIVYIRKGCHSKEIFRAEDCFPINKPNELKDCTMPLPANATTPCVNPYKNGGIETNPLCSWTKEDLSKLDDPEIYEIDKYFSPDGNARGPMVITWRALPAVRIGEIPISEPFTQTLEELEATTHAPADNQDQKEKQGHEEDITIATCPIVTRNKVKEYWSDPGSNQCAKSLTNALLVDQLRRFAASRFTKMFDSKVRSLEQISQLVVQTKDVFKLTCSEEYVPGEFLDVAVDAFLMFVNDDFFYGVEDVDQTTFERISKGLKSCRGRAEAFVYESEKMGCELKKITGTLILPSETVKVTIPESAKGKHFEPLIETAWKLFLNAHSYCFNDFLYPNDHHKFSMLFLQLFSNNIYEKWIEPLPTKHLYKFIVPKFEVLKEIMENIDYCVAATEKVSKCPVWLTRSNPSAKSIAESSEIMYLTPIII